ncbi:hypothetical protein ACJJTC_018920 [Scirpophaga incertulas]
MATVHTPMASKRRSSAESSRTGKPSKPGPTSVQNDKGKTGTGSPPEAPPAASDRLQRATDLYRNGMKCLNDSRNIKTEIKDQTKEAIKGLFNIVKSAEVEREKRQAEQKMKENSEEEIGRDETGSIKMCGQECKEKRVQMIEERDKYKRRCAELEIGMKEWQQEEREGKGCGRECENKRMKYGRECEKRIEKEWQKKDETNENRIRKLMDEIEGMRKEIIRMRELEKTNERIKNENEKMREEMNQNASKATEDTMQSPTNQQEKHQVEELCIL